MGGALDRWLGRASHWGKVVRVDPAVFLKVSALGIEEQRARVTIDFSDPAETWALAWTRLSRRRPCDHLERTGRPDRAGERLVSER